MNPWFLLCGLCDLCGSIAEFRIIDAATQFFELLSGAAATGGSGFRFFSRKA
jgi:hypothetical protein